MDPAGVVQDGMGLTSDKGLRLITAYAVTKRGLWASREAGGVSIAEGWFKPKDKGTGKQGRWDMGTEATAELLFWQAKIATEDYHAALTDSMFVESLERHLTPAFIAASGDKKVISFVDSASCHRRFDSEVGVP